MFDKQKDFEDEVLPLIKKLSLACIKHNLPMILSVATSDDGKKTKYYNTQLSSTTCNRVLSKDQLADIVLVMRGYVPTNPSEIRSITDDFETDIIVDCEDFEDEGEDE